MHPQALFLSLPVPHVSNLVKLTPLIGAYERKSLVDRQRYSSHRPPPDYVSARDKDKHPVRRMRKHHRQLLPATHLVFSSLLHFFLIQSLQTLTIFVPPSTLFRHLRKNARHRLSSQSPDDSPPG